MSIQQAYNQWAEQYDSNDNKTRDAEAIVLQTLLQDIHFHSCLEIGCGTGKNTQWLHTKANTLLGVDFSEAMLQQARNKIQAPNVQFVQANILEPWYFVQQAVDMVVFSLILEHIEDIAAIFKKAANTLQPGGYMYVGELHPFKQYTGSKARYTNENGLQVLTCYVHHLSEFLNVGMAVGFKVKRVFEYFDTDDANSVPRILGILFQLFS
ncbi:MAG: methyltransferase domain-containing protein [Sphingobacteriales bacterium]|uniref:class I SAM-dependent DNA methyltransferase n=1 Tax=Hydrotalea flava TaxID=714549 RepID=UPI00082F3DD5|nr:class I SAM-dependent methyltransferase [Hydrotalea flava]RTL52348.1 MAG: methyltransferase domain-containing protein [Sphingobacteriales bacterium]